jgi:hypothetical protein
MIDPMINAIAAGSPNRGDGAASAAEPDADDRPSANEGGSI